LGNQKHQVWSNATIVFSQVLQCDTWQSSGATMSAALSSISDGTTVSSIFNLRVFDQRITTETVKSLFGMVPDPAINPAFVPKSNSRFYLHPKDPLRSSTDPNSASGRLLATGPLVPSFNTTIGYSRGLISLSYFWVSMRINLNNAPAVSTDSYFPIFSIRTASGASVSIWWGRKANDQTRQASVTSPASNIKR
jgi:hypothetical protein